MENKGAKKAKLNKTFLDGLKPTPGKQFIVWDTVQRNFGVLVNPGGSKSFVISYRPKGSNTQRRNAFKRVGDLTVEEARKEAGKLLGQASEGQDPLEAKRSMKGITLAELWKEYLKDAEKRCKASTIREHSWRWKKHIAPKFGKKPLADIHRRDLASFHRKHSKTPRMSNLCITLVKAMINKAKEWGLFEGENPAEGIKFYPETSREKFLTIEELRIVLDAIDKEETLFLDPDNKPAGIKRDPKAPKQERGISPHVASLFRLLIFTGARLSEIREAKWGFFDRERGCLSLPDSKTGKKIIWLNALAVKELVKLEGFRSSSWIIESPVDPEKCLHNAQKPWKRVRERAGSTLQVTIEKLKKAGKQLDIDPEGFNALRIHDLRHSWASLAVLGGASIPLIGKALGHSQGRTTERYAHLVDDPVKLLAEQVGKAIAGATIEEIPSPKRDHGERSGNG